MMILKLKNGKNVFETDEKKKPQNNLGYNILKKWGSQQDKEYQAMKSRTFQKR